MIGIAGLISAITSYASASGVFDSVNGHEPRSAPGSGVACSVFVDEVRPTQSSGLASTSARVMLQARIQASGINLDADYVEVAIVDAADTLMTALVADFDLSGPSGTAVARSIDVRGMDGEGIIMRAGFVVQDSKQYRVLDIMIPIIVNDVWAEAA